MNEHCEHCDNQVRRMFYDFDGETVAQVRVGETLGYPAQLAVYSSDGCITFGINYCPRCGRDLTEGGNNAEYVKLPVGDDGEALEIGDELECLGKRVLLKSLVWNGKDWFATETVLSSGWYQACICRHVKPRTVENVLEEFADSYYRNVRNRAEPDAELVRKCAAEIRELLGVEG